MFALKPIPGYGRHEKHRSSGVGRDGDDDDDDDASFPYCIFFILVGSLAL